VPWETAGFSTPTPKQYYAHEGEAIVLWGKGVSEKKKRQKRNSGNRAGKRPEWGTKSQFPGWITTTIGSKKDAAQQGKIVERGGGEFLRLENATRKIRRRFS